MQSGDVIVKLGENSVTDLNSYMAALGKYKKGDATTVTILRGKDELKFNIIF
jgi:S1-C subfamily serine protease